MQCACESGYAYCVVWLLKFAAWGGEFVFAAQDSGVVFVEQGALFWTVADDGAGAGRLFDLSGAAIV